MGREQGSKHGEGAGAPWRERAEANHMQGGAQGCRAPGRGHSTSKGPEVGSSLLGWGSQEEPVELMLSRERKGTRRASQG